MSRYVETTNFGDSKAKNRCVILDQHSSRGEEFFDNYPEIRNLLEVTEDIFVDFVNLERDAGADALAGRLARLVAEESNGDTTVTLVKSLLPRAILDTNRVTARSIRNVVNYAGLPDLESDLREIQYETITEIREKLSLLLNASGVFVDIHTMAPYTPGVLPQSQTEVLAEKPDNLAHYVRAYINARRTGRRRYIDLVTALPGLPPIANPVLTSEIMKEMDKAHLKYRENDPYPTGPYIMSTEYMSHFPGILIETPKDYLTETQSDNESFNLIDPNISLDKVERIARPVALAINRCLNKGPARKR